ncbi:MAG: carbohydrate porin [Rhodospirillales bacterium]|nr:carbohydrate porin [Rhodospirillales bacterium]
MVAYGKSAIRPAGIALSRGRRPRRALSDALLSLAAAGVLFCLPCSGASAQEGEGEMPGTGLPEQVPPEPGGSPMKYDFEHNITGDWGGARNRLSDKGVDIRGGYAMEFLANPVGGLRQGETYVHNILLQGDFDLEKLLGVPKTVFRVLGSQRSGESLAKQDIGSAISVQQLYGGGETYRLVEAEFLTSLFDDRLNLAYGRLSATDDFLTSPLYCSFVNNGFCGQPPAPFFNMSNGITAYPTSVWGVRAKVSPIPETYVMVGVYDGDVNQDGKNHHGINFTFGDNGVLVLNEFGYTPQRGLFDLPGHYKVGAYYHSGHFDDVSKDANGNNLFITGVAAEKFTGTSGYYTLLDQMVYREAPEADQGLSVFFVAVASPDQEESTMPYFVSGGLVYQGLIGARPMDRTAFGVTNAWFSDKLSDARHDAGLEKQSTETALELNYQVQVTPAIYFRPDLQYIIKPNGQRDIDNAFVIGFEAGVTF